METFPTKALDQFPCPTWSIVSGSSFKEGRGKQLVRADPRSRVERVNTEIIRSGSLHRHDLILRNSGKPYVCFGCKEDGIGERFRCVRPECGRQYHKFCALPKKEGRGRQLVLTYPCPRVERVDSETIRSPFLHRHDLTLQNSRRPYVCSGCKEDGSGERFRCAQPECRRRQYHKFCALPEKDRNHRYFSGCCFNLFVRDGSSQCVDLYCAACSKDIEGFFFSCSRGGQEKNLHPWCMYLEPSLRVKNITMLLVPRMNNKCIECGCRTLMRNCRDQRGNVVPREMETWGYAREDGQDIIHIHCMKKRVGQYWRSMMTKDDLISRNPFPDDNSSGFVMELVKYMLEFFFRRVIGIPLTLTPPS